MKRHDDYHPTRPETRSRRAVLGTLCLTAATLSGCTTAATAVAGDASAPGDSAIDPSDTIYETREIESGHYYCWKLYLEAEDEDRRHESETVELDYEVTVHSGPAVDVFLLTREEMAHLRAKAPFEYLPDYSQLATTHAVLSSTVEIADYVLVVDNTTRGEATQWVNGTPRPVRVSVDIKTRYR